MDQIDLNFIGISGDIFFNVFNNNLLIQITSSSGIILYSNNYVVKYNINSHTNIKKYFISINPDTFDKSTLTTQNFSIYLVNYFAYIYTTLGSSTEKSLIFFNNYNYLPLIYLGLPNLMYPVQLTITYKYIKIGDTDQPSICNDINCSGTWSGSATTHLMKFANYFGNNNYFTGMLDIPGNYYKICIGSNGSIIEPSDVSSNLVIFQTKPNLDINYNTNIFFYNNVNNTSYIIYLNTYNFVDYKNSPTQYDVIPVLITWTDSTDLTNPNIPVYTQVLSLNLQTFNSSQLSDCGGIEPLPQYYNTLFFYNYVDNSVSSYTLNIFDYDYDKYFVNYDINSGQLSFQLVNIGSIQTTLYNTIISSDPNLNIPIIPTINYSFWFINWDNIMFAKLINPINTSNNLINWTLSRKLTFNMIISYLSNYSIKKYNVLKICNVFKTKSNSPPTSFPVKNYLYDNDVIYNYSNTNSNPQLINLFNNLVNCIRCRLIFYCVGISPYQIDTKLILDNYNLELYHKEYDFIDIPNDSEKIKLLGLLLLLASSSYKIKLCFYNIINSALPTIYLFNQVILTRNCLCKTSNYITWFDTTPQNNSNINEILKFNIGVKLDYFILFLYTKIGTILDSFDELIFSIESNKYMFKIFKIPNGPESPYSNGNLYKDKNLFYICFQNLSELNIFMEFLSTGKINLIPKNISNYFNIPNSVVFSCNYTINNYWVSENVDTPYYQITIGINKLKANQIYLYGDLNIDIV